MKTKTTGNTNNMNHLQQFAVKGGKKKSSENIRSVIYNRCSSEKQHTLEQQEKDCEFLNKELNLELIKIFGVKESAQTDDRKVFKEMMKFCEENNIGHIIVHNYDRLTRSGDVSLLKELREKGIRVHSVKQRLDDESSSGQFSQGLFVLFAKWENDQRRDRIVMGQKSKLRKGEWVGNPTIGYKKMWVDGEQKHDHERKQCIINEDGYKLQQAFYWKDQENLSNVEIIDRLKKMGLYLTPSRLTRIFRNPFYCGYITSALLDENEIIRGKHVPLISEDVFLRVNGIVNNNYHGYKVVRRFDEMPLKASVICGGCGRPITAYPRKNGMYIYYKCPNTGCCFNIRNIKLHDLFAAELSKLSINESLVPLIKTQLEATYWMLHSSEAAREKPMKDELTRLKNELETMEYNLAIGNIKPELFQKHSTTHKQKIGEIEESLSNLSQNTSNLDKMLDNSLKMASNLLNTWKLSDYNGKVRLQKLIFPEGLQYFSENKALRTPKINPIFSAITSISIINEDFQNAQKDGQAEKLRQLYLTFASSNSFWGHLEEINTQMIDFENKYPQICQSYLNPWSGRSSSILLKAAINQIAELFPERIPPPAAIQIGLGAFSGGTGVVGY